ncbi:MAG: response regulator [Myxococcota bacterium]|jgi:PAS domain S-box-containing protein|nr:response regulator [Myxococcota bacterium]
MKLEGTQVLEPAAPGVQLRGSERVHLQKDYVIFLTKLADNIVYIDTTGTLKNYDVERFDRTLADFCSRHQVKAPYVQIRNLGKVAGRLPFHLMKAQIASFLAHQDVLCGIVILQQPSWLKAFIQHAQRLYKTRFQVAIGDDLAEGMRLAREILDARSPGPSGRPLHLQDVVVSNDWVYRNPRTGCEYRIGIIPNKLYMVSVSGQVSCEEDIIEGGRLLERVLLEHNLVAVPYIIVDYSDLTGIRSLRLRQRWAKEADRINRLTGNTRATHVAVNPDRPTRIAIQLFAPLMKQRALIVGSMTEAFEQINELSGTPEALDRRRKLSVSAADLEELSDALGMLLWHAGDTITEAPMSADNPLSYLVETIGLIRSDLNELMERERRSQTERLAESEAHRLRLLELMRMNEAAYEALRASEQRYQLIDASTRDFISAYDLRGRLTHTNRALCEALGKAPEELLGKTHEELGIPQALCDAWSSVHAQVLATGCSVSTELSYQHGEELRKIELVVNPMRDATGVIVGVSSNSRDVSERYRMQEEQERLRAQLVQAQKMESVGRLAGGVAHDFNNMLSVIKGNVELALEQVASDSPLREELLEIRQATQNSAKLTGQLLAFARRQTAEPRVLDLNATVEGTLSMLRRLIGEDVQISWEPSTQLPPVYIDPSQIDQVLTNLCLNARDAIQAQGRISIRSRREQLERPEGELPAGSFVVLGVTDDGHGMGPETLSQLFEPFFTTKEQGKGTGLGLSMIYGIARQNGGTIRVSSRLGEGSVFDVYLPAYSGERTPDAELGHSPPLTLQSQGETVLLVEDEPSILKLACRVLSRQGYQVLAASTPEQALALAQAHQGKLDLLLTDVIMPEMNGRELATRLQARYPGLRKLFMSGYTQEIIGHQGILEEGVHFLNKPFSPEELEAKVREALEALGPA